VAFGPHLFSKRAMAGKTTFSQRKAAEILSRVRAGESLHKILTKRADYKPPCCVDTWYKWLHDIPGLVDRHTEAMALRADKFFEEIAEIADAPPQMLEETIMRGGEKVVIRKVDAASEQQRRTQIDARKFIVARLSPKKYGDKMTQEITGADGGPIQTQVTTYKVALPDNGRN
jgi:hypothetical protein